ncbi:MAG TPA: sugar ABC transporter permease, partial [Candidatus Hydrogenedentes bacterium]|nr:sugar ABC transporter permease [Candidatus Hydrogenedentota bacterium]
MTRMDRRNLRNGLLFIAPYLIGFGVFALYPLVMSVYYSFTHFNVIQPPVWTGIENYRILFFEDPLFWKSLYNTLYYTAFAVPLGLAFSIAIALLLHQKTPAMPLFRTVFFLPSIVPI